MSDLKLEMKNDLKMEGQATTPFGVAEGVSLELSKQTAEHGANAELLALDLEASKKRIEQSGAGAFVAEISAKCLDGIGGTVKAFGKVHEMRRDFRLGIAKKQYGRIESIINSNKDKADKEEQKKIMTARVKEINPDFQVNTGFFKGIGEKFSNFGDIFKNMYKSWEKAWYKFNTKDAQNFANRAQSAEMTASKFAKLAADLRAQKGTLAESQRTLATKGNEDVKGYESIKLELTTEEKRKIIAERGLKNARDKDYFMPAASAMGDNIRDDGGDQSLSAAQKAVETFANRAIK